ncbi:sensor histidine kinase [Arthrobacter sp. Sr24]
MTTSRASSPSPHFETLFHQAPAGYVITSTDGTILEVNDTFLAWCGLERDSVEGTNLLMLFPVGDRIMYATHALPQLATTGEFRELAADIVGAAGQRFPAMLSATRGPVALGKVPVDRIIVFSAPRRRSYESELESALRRAEDAVNARIRAEADAAAHLKALVQKELDLQALLRQSRRNESILEAVLDTVDVGIAVVDTEGHEVMKNSRYQNDLSHATASEGGERLLFGLDRTTPSPPMEKPRLRAAKGESFSDELFWVGPPSDLRALSFSARTIKGINNFTGSVLAVADLTRLINAMAAQEDFVANVSHELRTPLTSIIGYLDLVLDEPELPGHIAAPLTVAMRNSERLLELVSDLLSTATPGGAINLQSADLAEIIHARMASATLRANAKDISLLVEIPSALPAEVDPLRIGQVIDNLLANAIKYSPNGGRITISARYTPETIVMEVTDTGMGMTAEEVQQAFSKFFRSGAVRKAAIPGAGLGLAITKSIVEAHQGSITLTSDVGQGTTATIALPRNPRPS